MRRLVVVVTFLALYFVPAGVARAPSVFTLRVGDAAAMKGANVRCFAKEPKLLVCGGGTSKIFVEIRATTVEVFRATGPSLIFQRLYRVQR